MISEKGAVVGLGLKIFKPASKGLATAEGSAEIAGYDMKDSGKRFFGPVPPKPSTYLSTFIIYIATIGDIVDGTDTTHDFNFFSLVYEWPKEVRNSIHFPSHLLLVSMLSRLQIFAVFVCDIIFVPF